MDRTHLSAPRLARRYIPLIGVVAVLALVVALAQSKPTTDAEQDLGARPTNGDRPDVVGSIPVPTDADVEVDGAPVDGSAGKAPRRRAPGAVDAGATARGPRTQPADGLTGSTDHCVSGRQFDPEIDFHAPPCAAQWTGQNPGATTRGVTADEIHLIDYWIDPGRAPSTFFRAQDIYATAEQQARFDEAVERFINTHYELHGRRVRIELFRSGCSTQPPDPACFRAEAAQIVADHRPFAVVNNTVFPMSFFFDELSQRRTVNVGGWQLTDAFSEARRPYHWDPNISGTRMAETFADWYCSQLHGRPVQYAGTPRPPGRSFNGRPRVLGVIAFDDPEHKAVVESALEPALAKCGAEVAHTYLIEPNLASASIQNQAAITTMQSAPEATSLLCICGPAMAQAHATMQERNYYPEQLMPGNSMTDLDSVAQAFSGPLGCPSGSDCQSENMFGLSQFGAQQPRFGGVGTRIWRAAGNSGNPPHPRVDLDWTYWSMLASLIQAAGPDLTPTALEHAAAALPARGGGSTGQPLRHFPGGSHHWIQDMRRVYWSTTTRSPYNDVPGTWIQVGDRIQVGESPTGTLSLPPKPR